MLGTLDFTGSEHMDFCNFFRAQPWSNSSHYDFNRLSLSCFLRCTVSYRSNLKLFCPFFLGSHIQDRLLHVKWRLKDPNHNRKTHYDPSGHGDISTFVSSRDRWYVPYSAHLGSPAKGPGLLSYNALARQFRWSWLWVWNGRSCGCLVPSPLYCARPMQFGWRGPSEFFVSDNSPKCIEREGLERHRKGTREGLVVRSIGKCGSRIKILKSGIRIVQ